MKTIDKESGGGSQESGALRLISLLLATGSLLLISWTCEAQPSQYHVVRVVGTVESPTLNRALKTGDIIQSKDHLRFGTKESYIIVNSPQTGRKRISGVPDNTPREFIQLLQSFVQPDTKSTSTRSISLEYLEALQSSLAFDTLLILGDGFIPVNTKKLSLAKPAVVRAWYSDTKRKPVYHNVSDIKGFYLNSKSIYGNQSHHNNHRVIIEYFEDEKEDPAFSPGSLLAAFVPMFADESSLATEIRALIDARDSSKTIQAEINEYLREEYAPVQEDNLKAWLKAQGISIE